MERVSQQETTPRGAGGGLELEARYEALFRAAADGIVVIDQQGLIRAFNGAAERIFQYPAADVLGRNVGILMPASDARQHDDYLANYLRSGQPRVLGTGREVVGRRRDGTCFPMDLALGEVVLAESIEFVGYIRDITRRKRTEEALRWREWELRQVVENVPVGIFTAERPGIIRSANPALQRMLQFDAVAIAGLPLTALGGREGETRMQALLDTLDTHGDATGELEWTRRDGAMLEVSVHLGSVAREEAAPLIVGQVIDHTERRRGEALARQAREQLAHVGRLATLGEMASAIAHEINQPLTAVATHAQACRRLIESGKAELGLLATACEQIAEQAIRTGEIVKRIRAFVTKRESTRERCEARDLMTSVLALAAPDLHEVGLAPSLDLEASDTVLVIDQVQIQQVCLNLILNAIDAMAVLPMDVCRLEIRGRRRRRSYTLAFEDSGPGVPPPMRERLFHPFFTTKTDGMGMGLSISHSLVIAHGGSLRYEDGVLGGACFVVELPFEAGGEPR